MRWFIFPPYLFSVHTLPRKITKLAVKERLFENKQVNYTLVFHDFCYEEELIRVFKMLSIYTHALCQPLSPFVDGCINNLTCQRVCECTITNGNKTEN